MTEVQAVQLPMLNELLLPSREASVHGEAEGIAQQSGEIGPEMFSRLFGDGLTKEIKQQLETDGQELVQTDELVKTGNPAKMQILTKPVAVQMQMDLLPPEAENAVLAAKPALIPVQRPAELPLRMTIQTGQSVSKTATPVDDAEVEAPESDIGTTQGLDFPPARTTADLPLQTTAQTGPSASKSSRLVDDAEVEAPEFDISTTQGLDGPPAQIPDIPPVEPKSDINVAKSTEIAPPISDNGIEPQGQPSDPIPQLETSIGLPVQAAQNPERGKPPKAQRDVDAGTKATPPIQAKTPDIETRKLQLQLQQAVDADPEPETPSVPLPSTPILAAPVAVGTTETSGVTAPLGTTSGLSQQNPLGTPQIQNTETLRLDREDWTRKLAQDFSPRLSTDAPELEVILHPESLGKLHLRLELINATAIVHFVTETAEAARLLNENTATLSEELAQNGLQLGGSDARRQGKGSDTPMGQDAKSPDATKSDNTNTPEPANAPAKGARVNLIA